MQQIFLGLGANLSDPVAQIKSAIADVSLHPDCALIATSRLYASTPMGPQNQPNYVNAVIEITTNLSPISLLDMCQSIEQKHHRLRLEHWGPRTLDIDILSYADWVLDEPRLILPHAGIAQRDFVLLPWRDIAPNFIIPNLGRVFDLCEQVSFYHATPLLNEEISFEKPN